MALVSGLLVLAGLEACVRASQALIALLLVSGESGVSKVANKADWVGLAGGLGSEH